MYIYHNVQYMFIVVLYKLYSRNMRTNDTIQWWSLTTKSALLKNSISTNSLRLKITWFCNLFATLIPNRTEPLRHRTHRNQKSSIPFCFILCAIFKLHRDEMGHPFYLRCFGFDERKLNPLTNNRLMCVPALHIVPLRSGV